MPTMWNFSWLKNHLWMWLCSSLCIWTNYSVAIVIAMRKILGTSSDWGSVGRKLYRALSYWYQLWEIISTECTYVMNETLSQYYLTWGSHVMGLCRLMYIIFCFKPQSQYSVCVFCSFMTYRKNRFIKNHTYIWVVKTLDIVASSIIYTYDVDKT